MSSIQAKKANVAEVEEDGKSFLPTVLANLREKRENITKIC